MHADRLPVALFFAYFFDYIHVVVRESYESGENDLRLFSRQPGQRYLDR